MRHEAVVVLFSTILLNNAFSKDIPAIVSTGCTKKDFTYEYASCTFECSLDLTGTDYLADGYQFSYYSNDSSISVNTSNVGDNDIDVGYSYMNNQVKLTLEIMNANYYAGHYMCWIHLANINGGSQQVNHIFLPIDSNNIGLPLGSKCNNEHECWALNAECSVICQCPSDCVNYNGRNDTPACLAPSSDNCIADAQCNNYWGSYYHCVGNTCTYIDDCAGLSAGAIAGIVVGGVAFVLLIALLIFYDHKRVKKFWKTHRVVGVAAAVVVIEDISNTE